MKRLRASRRRMVAIGALTAVMVVFAAGYGYSATADTNNVYNGCLKSGTISNVTIAPAPAPTCGRGAVPISWNQTGPQGDPGTPGTNGTNGTNGVSVTSATEPAGTNCPNGGSKFTAAANNVTYACNGADASGDATDAHLYGNGGVQVPINADDSVWTPVVTINDPAVGSYWILASLYIQSDGARCTLDANGTDVDSASMNPGGGEFGQTVLTLQTTHTFTASGGQVRLRCQKLSGFFGPANVRPTVTLLKVGSATNSFAGP